MTDPENVDWRDKALWPIGSAEPTQDYVAAGHSLFDGSVSWPAMIVREEALTANIETLAGFCRSHGLDFAPHGKTSMAPRLFQRQLAAGAWGITLATAHQVRVARGFGVQRILLANELLDGVALDWIAAELAADPAFEFLCFVDSAEGVAAISAAGLRQPGTTGIRVLIDVGFPGGRTGVRTPEQALALARLVAATDGIRLAGVSCYEGALKSPEAVRDYFAVVRGIVETLVGADLVDGRPVLTAGGSSYFDVVAAELGGDWARGLGLQLVLRSGAYATHDDGVYRGKTAYNRIPEEGRLVAALEVWAQVVSAPEAGLAIVGLGKRDAPYDEGLPIPLAVRRAGDGSVVDIRGRAEVSALDDQHGYLRGELSLRPGDLVCFGISHPCTAFDKWRVLPLVDADDRIVELLRTYF